MWTTLQSKHTHLQFLFSQITPLANVSKIRTHHIWRKPNIFSLLDPSQYLPKVLQRWSWSCDWLKVKVPWLRICVGLTYEQRDTELCNGASLTALLPCWWCSWLVWDGPSMTGPHAHVQIGLDSSSLVLLEDWHCLCTFSSPLGIPLGEPDAMQTCAGGLLTRVMAVNKSVHSIMLAMLPFQIFAPKCLFCATCGFLEPLAVFV